MLWVRLAATQKDEDVLHPMSCKMADQRGVQQASGPQMRRTAAHTPVSRQPSTTANLCIACSPGLITSRVRATCVAQRSSDGGVHADTLPATAECPASSTVSRRAALSSTAAAVCLGSMYAALPAQASKLPAFADRAWEALGGGPSDLFFPDEFEGVWDVTSTLTEVSIPQGESLVPDIRVVKRAQQEDLNRPITYQVKYIRNGQDQIIYDRRYNTASLLSYYYGRPAEEFLNRIEWDANDPNVLQLEVPGGLSVRTRVTRRLSEDPEPGQPRLETSEFFEQVYDSSGQAESGGPTPKIKASQCFTKFKWRPQSQAAAGQPTIVAVQVISDYLSALSGEDAKFLAAGGKPVVMMKYRLSFVRSSEKQRA